MFAHTSRLEVAVRIGAAVPAIALAGALVMSSARVQAADDESAASYLCRPVAAGETANAAMTQASHAALECVAVGMTLKMSDGSLHTIGQASAKRQGPDLSKALTPGQVNDAWVKWTEAMFHVIHQS